MWFDDLTSLQIRGYPLTSNFDLRALSAAQPRSAVIPPTRMSASKKRARSSDRVFLNVGGEVFQTTISTLTANSEFFSRKFSSEWSSDAEDEIFLR